MLDLTHQREQMVDAQIAGRGVHDIRVLAAMRRVPRDTFVEPGFEEFAYEDTPLPIGEGQTISQPYIVALMIEAAEVKPGDVVLEIGAGSGYAAAVISQIADRVYAIERHSRLVEAARGRFERVGYDNIEIRPGDGTRGWPDAAPFDAIIVSAGGPIVPIALKEQLAVGGRLVIPVGGRERQQVLLKITRKSETEYDEENFGAVTFVPLIGEQGWSDRERPSEASTRLRSLPELIRAASQPLPDIDEPGFGRLFDRFAECRVVLLGDATHGTSEFYRARAEITRRLIEKHGFTIVAIEADWPDVAAVDRYVRHRPAPAGVAVKPPFQRFPTWMWRNAEFASLIDWMREHNERIPEPERRSGIYGLDIYNMSGSIAAVLTYLDRIDPQAATVAHGTAASHHGRRTHRPTAVRY